MNNDEARNTLRVQSRRVRTMTPHSQAKATQTPEEMYYRRLTGLSLESIARDNNITRERVRQIVEKYEEETGVEKALDLVKQRIIAKKDEALRRKKSRDEHVENLRAEIDITILSMSIEGFSEIEIADALSVERGYVSRTLIRERGVVKERGPNIPLPTIEEMYKLSLRGISHTEIAELFGYTQGGVSRALARYVKILEENSDETTSNSISSLRKEVRSFSHEEIEDMYNLSLQGISQTKIGERYGITQVKVSKLLMNRKRAS